MIIQKFISVNPYSRPNIKLKGVKGIVMHYTASPSAPAINIVKYFDGLKNQNSAKSPVYASAHYSVDDNSIYQAIPDDEMAYHCGSNTYTSEALKRLSKYPNDCTIGIEMCIDKNGNITEKTFQNAVDLVVTLCKKFSLTENDIWTHKGIVGWKNCPLPWVNNPNEFERFKRCVKQKLNISKEEKNKENEFMKFVMSDQGKQYAKNAISSLAQKGYLNNPDDWEKRVDDGTIYQELPWLTLVLMDRITDPNFC
ncbi:N-acetylmuramoyl-L-alanine amidase [Brevibacillus gelatini]|uniref:N-acetylmuramoyl-L-alanine amidase n=1 Tax=Brevibacillus gelatini TaxID=1655277 RepID=A0A3M8AQ74_9BACL|nr:N-acetylmuramoyl-L-alanine amidase [Brevibacillus gelatini]RNB52695.1 N-acetylmuramoyl-L-alanine amidase [Brevibacillus gelatini]